MWEMQKLLTVLLGTFGSWVMKSIGQESRGSGVERSISDESAKPFRISEPAHSEM
jgi:hypothetical protein